MIPTFLQLVAEDLRNKYGNDLSNVVVVSPNKRAGLFMNEHLTYGSSTPIWAPRYITISELFRSFTPLRLADSIDTVCRIYQHYTALTNSNETLDFFYGWGERILADFDDVDKNLCNATALFQNLQDIKEIESSEYLTTEQEKVLQSFFHSFSLDNKSAMRRNFLQLWNNLLPIYNRLREELFDEGLAYEGALYRNVIENLEANSISASPSIKTYVFIGFNVLSEVEKRLFSHLQQKGLALFYWDYDIYYTSENTRFEAGIFLRENLQCFPSELPAGLFNNLLHEKDIEYASAATESIQAGSVTEWLEKHLTQREEHTAVVLCNEDMLQPVLHAIPANVQQINITKGYPLHHTMIYTLVDEEPTEGFTSAGWLEVLRSKIKELSNSINEQTGTSPQATLRTEACFKTYTLIERLSALIEKGRLDVMAPTLQRLLCSLMRQATIPFSGEPAEGLQIMGLLETRCLDFENILFLSVSEGNLPRRENVASFIPYDLRREFNLTTPLRSTAVYAYYFYRLIQRAKHIRMVYSTTVGNGGGERSRFMTQLLIESGLPIRQLSLIAHAKAGSIPLTRIKKPEQLYSRIRSLSPSAINTYIRCPLNFYFHYVAGLREPEPEADVIAPNKFGSIFHKAAELFYDEFTERFGVHITSERLRPQLAEDNEPQLRSYVKRAFAEEKTPPSEVVEEVILTYFRQLLRHDLQLTPFTLVDTERKVNHKISVPYDGKEVEVTLYGIIDRIDRTIVDGKERLRIVDYKTGGKSETAADIEALFTPAKSHPHYILQTFLYSLTQVSGSHLPIAPALFFVHRAAEKEYNPYITFSGDTLLDFSRIAPDVEESLKSLIATILDPNQDFTATTIPEHCRNCAYAALCRK